jgi:DNA-directed RNA polymerase II subunit RPB1
VNTDEIEVPPDSPFINESNKIGIYMKDIVIPNLNKLSIAGIANIEKIRYRQEPDSKKWYIEAIGSNLLEIYKKDYVDKVRTYCNNMWDIYHIFGIEAVRRFLMEEFDMILSSDTYINKRHISLLTDIMLFTGTISSISRYGVHRNQSGPISRSSFEESLDMFLKAGLYGEKESTNGVSAAIICGKPSSIGTGLCTLLYNPPQ